MNIACRLVVAAGWTRARHGTTTVRLDGGGGDGGGPGEGTDGAGDGVTGLGAAGCTGARRWVKVTKPELVGDGGDATLGRIFARSRVTGADQGSEHQMDVHCVEKRRSSRRETTDPECILQLTNAE